MHRRPLRTENEHCPNGSWILWAEREPAQMDSGRVMVVYACCGRRRVVVLQDLHRYRRPTPLRCNKCARLLQRQEGHHRWQGGIMIHAGYVFVHEDTLSPADRALVVGHTRHSDAYIAEHRLVMARVLGRPLSPEEVVHHINGHKRDNRPDNLMVLPAREHALTYSDLWRALGAAQVRIRELEAIIKGRSP